MPALLAWILPVVAFAEMVWSGLSVLLVFAQVLVMGVFWFFVYGLARLRASSLARVLREQQCIAVDGEAGTRRLRLRIRDYFQWTVTVNPDKGVAGGNIKMDFPIGSGLLLSACCLAFAYFAGFVSRFIVPGIFLYFGFHHLRRWFGALRVLGRLKAVARQGTRSQTALQAQLRVA